VKPVLVESLRTSPQAPVQGTPPMPVLVCEPSPLPSPLPGPMPPLTRLVGSPAPPGGDLIVSPPPGWARRRRRRSGIDWIGDVTIIAPHPDVWLSGKSLVGGVGVRGQIRVFPDGRGPSNGS
jgi:hypothetical protein